MSRDKRKHIKDTLYSIWSVYPRLDKYGVFIECRGASDTDSSISAPAWAHRELCFKSRDVVTNLDCNYTLPSDSTPYESPFGDKSIGKR